LFAVVPAMLYSNWMAKMQQRKRLERLWFWSKEQGDRHIDCVKSVHRKGVRESVRCVLATLSVS
jgi:hypothetical protein